MCEVVSKTLLYKNIFVSKKTPLFSQKTHCFPTCALLYPIVLKRKIFTGANGYATCMLLPLYGHDMDF